MGHFLVRNKCEFMFGMTKFYCTTNLTENNPTYLVESMDGAVERENARIVTSVCDVETANES